MKTLSTWRRASALALSVFVLLPAHAAGRAAYTIRDLGPITGGDTSAGAGINANGAVCGRSGDQAAVWDGRSVRDLGTLAGSLDSDAVGLNTAGQVAGNMQLSPFFTVHASVWSLADGSVRDCGTLGGTFSQARGINRAGVVVGVSDLARGGAHGFVWNGNIRDLGTRPGDWKSAAYSVNDRGQIVGFSTAHDGTDHAVVWQGGDITDIGALNNGRQSRGYAIGADGAVVGEIQVAGGHWHAALWRAKTLTDLGTLDGDEDSRAVAVNAAGQIVGSSRATLGAFAEQVAFVTRAGVPADLNALLPAASGWTLTDATAINDRGQICGVGVLHGHSHAYLLTPAGT